MSETENESPVRNRVPRGRRLDGEINQNNSQNSPLQPQQLLQQNDQYNGSSSSNNNNNNINNINRNTFDGADDNSRPPAPQPSGLLSCFRSTLCCNLGYNLSVSQRAINTKKDRSPPLFSAERSEGFSLGARIDCLETSTSELMGMIRPVVRLHAVNVHTGRYLQGRKRPPTAPLSTSPYPLHDPSDVPVWEEELVLDANYSDIVSEESLLLFEVLDYRPSLNFKNSRSKGPRPAKQIAWGYLLPVGVCGALNVGVKEEWAPTDAVNVEDRGKGRRASRAGQGDGAGTLDLIPEEGQDGGEGGERRLERSKASRDKADKKARRVKRSDVQREGGAGGDGEGEGDGGDLSASGGESEGGGGERGGGGRAGRRPSQGNERSSTDENEDEQALLEDQLLALSEQQRALSSSASFSGTSASKRAVERVSQRIQLYSYQLNDGMLGALQRAVMGWPSLKPTISKKTRSEVSAYPDNVPSVYLQWRMQQRLPIKFGILDVTLGPRRSELATPQAYAVGLSGSLAAMMLMGTGDADSPPRPSRRQSRVAVMEDRPPQPHLPPHLAGMSKAQLAKANQAAARRARAPKEPCVITDHLLHRLEVGPEGAMVVAFSHCGHLLAVACKSPSAPVPFSSETATSPSPGCTYALKLYDTDVGTLVWAEVYAHHGVIYDMKWTRNDSYLLTASADGSTKIWDLLSLLPLWTSQKDPSPSLSPSLSLGLGMDDYEDRVGVSPSRSISPSRSGSFVVKRDGGSGKLNGGGWPSSVRRAPHLSHTLASSPPVFIYSGVFQEHSTSSASQGTFTGFSSIGGTLDSSDNGRIVQSFSTDRTPPPRVITGSSDGRLRVWDGTEFKGKIRVEKLEEGEDGEEGGFEEDFAPHTGHVNALVIDERTRYLLSGDSAGDILVWRTDSHGWYELLRRFKRDTPTEPLAAVNRSTIAASRTAVNRSTNVLNRSLVNGGTMKGLMKGGGGGGGGGAAGGGGGGGGVEAVCGATGVMSLCMHPDKYKTQMLSLSLEPSQLKVYNTTTYKVHSVCAGSSSAGGSTQVSAERTDGCSVFSRASLSADGRIIACGTSNTIDRGSSRLRFWDTQTGHAVPSSLSDLPLPFPVRSVSWHPTQHLMAVAMLGPGASVAVYCGQRESAERAINRINRNASASLLQSVAAVVVGEAGGGPGGGPGGVSPSGVSNSTDPSSSSAAARARIEAARLKNVALGFSSEGETDKRPTSRDRDGKKENVPLKMSDLPPVKESIRSLRSEKAREILEKIRAAKGQ